MCIVYTIQPVAIVVIMAVSATTSAFVDNIPYTTTMVPVIKQIAEEVPGVNIEPLIWSLSFGACLVRASSLFILSRPIEGL